jgi:hypothetical protein
VKRETGIVSRESFTGKTSKRLTIPKTEYRFTDLGAEGASLGQAKPDETLRQKDPVPTKLWKVRSPAIELLGNDTDGVKFSSTSPLVF